MYDAAFVADTNVVHWVGVNSLTRDVFTVPKVLEELGRINPNQQDVLFLGETCNYFKQHPRNVLSNEHRDYGMAMDLRARRLIPYGDISTGHILSSCIKEGWKVTQQDSLVDPAIRMYRGRLRGKYSDIERKMPSHVKAELESALRDSAIRMGTRLLNGEGVRLVSGSAGRKDRDLAVTAGILPHDTIYLLSADPDLKPLVYYAEILFDTRNNTVVVDRAEMIPKYLQKTA